MKDLATVKVAVAFSRNLKDFAERSACYHLLCHCRREWSFCFEKMDVNARSSHSNEKKSIDYSASANERNMSMEKNADTSVFVNHGKSLLILFTVNSIKHLFLRQYWEFSRFPNITTESLSLATLSLYCHLLTGVCSSLEYRHNCIERVQNVVGVNCSLAECNPNITNWITLAPLSATIIMKIAVSRCLSTKKLMRADLYLFYNYFWKVQW